MVVMRQHNVWCMCVTFCVGRYVGLQSNIPLHTEPHAVHQMLCCRITTVDLLHFLHFKFSDFNKELTQSLKMI